MAIALLFNFASFIGFEAITIYSEEARDPKRTVPRATYVAVLTIGIFYTITTYLMVEGQGAAGLQEYLGTLQPDPTAFLFVLGETYIGAALTIVMSLLFISSVFAALLAFHNAVARYLYALGREGLVPAQLGRTHTKHLSPHAGSLSQSVLAFVVILIFVITGQDPVPRCSPGSLSLAPWRSSRSWRWPRSRSWPSSHGTGTWIATWLGPSLRRLSAAWLWLR